MQHEDRVRILDMIDAADKAASFVTGRCRDDMDRDAMLLFAVVRAIEIIGEAASKVSAETRTAAPQVPWRTIVAMRNRVIHGYSKIDPDIVWKTATEDIPSVVPLLRTLADTDTA